MFMVSRRVGERIVIGGVIHIEIAKITRGGVRLAITAPKEHAIMRGEVWEAIAQANRDAASISVDDAEVAAALVTNGRGAGK
jgi:carbon storage regulator